MRSELPLRLSRRLSWSRSNRLEGPGGDSPRHCVVGSCWRAAASDRNSTLASSSVTNASRSRSSSRSNTKEALYVAVLPRRTRLDEQSLHTNTTQPLPNAFGRELSRESLRVSMLTQHLACGRSRQWSCDHAVTQSWPRATLVCSTARCRNEQAGETGYASLRYPARDWHRLLKQSVPVPVLCLCHVPLSCPVCSVRCPAFIKERRAQAPVPPPTSGPLHGA